MKQSGRRSATNSENALSNTLDTVLLVALTVIVCAILLALLLGMIPNIQFKLFNFSEEQNLEIIAITEIDHKNADGKPTYASRVKLTHRGIEPLFNSDYSAELYVNGKKKPVFIKTLRGTEFIPTKHYGVGQLAGPGVQGYYWNPGEWAWVNFGDEIITPDDEVELRILRNSDKEIISVSVKRAPKL